MRPVFAGNGKYFVDTHSATLIPPPLSLCVVRAFRETGGRASCQQIWEGRSIADYAPVAPKQLQFNADDGTPLYGYLILPPSADANAKVPLIVYIYGGPADQTVKDAWGGTTRFSTSCS